MRVEQNAQRIPRAFGRRIAGIGLAFVVGLLGVIAPSTAHAVGPSDIDTAASYTNITVTNQVTGNPAGVEMSTVNVSMNWSLPNNTPAGSKFGLVLPSELSVVDSIFQLKTDSGDPIADCVATANTNTFVCTLTDWVTTNYENIEGTIGFAATLTTEASIGENEIIFNNGFEDLPAVPFDVIPGAVYADEDLVKLGRVVLENGKHYVRWDFFLGSQVPAGAVLTDEFQADASFYRSSLLHTHRLLDGGSGAPDWNAGATVSVDLGLWEISTEAGSTTATIAIDDLRALAAPESRWMTLQMYVEIPETIDVTAYNNFINPVATLVTSDSDVLATIPGKKARNEFLVGGAGNSDAPARVSVGDYVWLDTNGDGLQDTSESGIAGVVLTLSGPNGPATDVNGNPVTAATTDSNGRYTFEKLPVLAAGEKYTVTIDQAASATALEGLVPTLDKIGDDRGIDSNTWIADTVHPLVENGFRDPTLDFGFVYAPPTPDPSVSVGDYVWWDTNDNGLQDDGDAAGIAGVTLTLTRTDGSSITDIHGDLVTVTVTDDQGRYSFDNLPVLPNGVNYVVTVTAPDKSIAAQAGAGTDRGADSSTVFETAIDLPNDGDRDPSLDFGFVPTAPVIDLSKNAEGDDSNEVEVGEHQVVVTITNNGNEDLENLIFSDITESGADVTWNQADLEALDGLVLKVGESITVTGTVVVDLGETHRDLAKIDANGVISGDPVTDEDPTTLIPPTTVPPTPVPPTPEEPRNPGPNELVNTGGASSLAGIAAASLLVLAGAGMLLARRKHASSQ